MVLCTRQSYVDGYYGGSHVGRVIAVWRDAICVLDLDSGTLLGYDHATAENVVRDYDAAEERNGRPGPGYAFKLTR